MNDSIDAQEFTAIAQLGRSYMQCGREAQAQTIFSGLTALRPTHPYPWHALGELARRRGDMERAVGCLRHAQSLDQASAPIAVSLAEALILANRASEAVSILQGVATRGDAHAARARQLLRRIHDRTAGR